jgi:hypothetical protein
MLKNKYTPIFILFIFNLVFFIKPLLFGLYLSPADILQRFPSFSTEGFRPPDNSLMMDVVTQFQPWYEFNKQSILNGNFPLWNDLNSGGVPHFANNISAFLFPLNIIFLLFPDRLALLFFYFTKMFLIGIFTYYYLREIKVGKYESLVGATGFNFALFNITWLFWPQTNVIIFLPLQLLLIEKFINGSLNNARFVTFLSISFAFSLFAGHPETMFHITMISVFYFLFRVLSIKEKISKVNVFILASLIGVLLSSIQLLPFFEYLSNSYILYERGVSEHGGFLPGLSAVYNFFPNLTGNPSTEFSRSLFGGNYNETTGAYLGLIIFLLALWGVYRSKKDDLYILFYVLLSLFCLPFIFQLPVFYQMGLLANQYSANTRLLFAVGFGQAVIASIALTKLKKDKLLNKISRLSYIAIPVVAVISVILLNLFASKLISDINENKLNEFINYLGINIVYLSVLLMAGLYVIQRIVDQKKYRDSWLVVLSVIVFLQTGLLNINYNPTISEEYYYPKTLETKLLGQLPKGNLIQLGGNHIIHPDVNMKYGIRMVENYDAMDIKEYKELFLHLMDNKEEWNGQLINTSQDHLNLFGVRYIASYTDINNVLRVNQNQAKHYLSGIKDNIVQTQFTAFEDDLYAIRLLPANFNRINDCNYQISITQGSDLIHSQTYKCADLYDKIYKQYDIDVQQNSLDKEYSVTIEFISGEDDISFWTNDDGELVFQTLYLKEGDLALEELHRGNFNIFENKKYLGDFYFVKQARFFEKEDMLEHLNSSNFDPYDHVVLEKSLQKQRIIKQDQRELRLDHKRINSQEHQIYIYAPNDGYLVSAIPYYPGWKAEIDGGSVEVIRGNYAFAVIPVSQGEQTIRYYYDPLSF